MRAKRGNVSGSATASPFWRATIRQTFLYFPVHAFIIRKVETPRHSSEHWSMQREDCQTFAQTDRPRWCNNQPAPGLA